MAVQRVFVSKQAYLPSGPTPATIVVVDGKIAQVHSQVLSRSCFADVADADYIDTGDKWLLPGVSIVAIHWYTHGAYRIERAGRVSTTSHDDFRSRCSALHQFQLYRRRSTPVLRCCLYSNTRLDKSASAKAERTSSGQTH